MPIGVLPHYRSCLLVWCLIINHVCWYASSLTMPVGVVPHYMPCLLVNCQCNHHFTSRVQMEEGWLQVWCYQYKGCIISDLSDVTMPLSDLPACTMQLYQTCMLGSHKHLRMFLKCCSTKRGIWSVTNPSGMHTGRMPLSQGCKTCWVSFWTPSCIYQILNDVFINSITRMLQG